MRKRNFMLLLIALLPMVGWGADGEMFYETTDGVTLAYVVLSEEEKTVEVVDAPALWSVYDASNDCWNSCHQDVDQIHSISIPSEVRGYRVIATSGSFADCRYLISIVLPEGVERIGGDFLCGHEMLVNVTLPSTLTEIGNRCFEHCISLQEITLPVNLRSSDSRFNGFYGCRNLKTLNILCKDASWLLECSGYDLGPDPTPEAIMNHANLSETVEHLYFGKDVEQLAYSDDAIPGPFTSVKTIEVDPANPYLDSRENCNAVINKANNELIYGCASTVIPSSVTSIGAGAFLNRFGLKDIDIPEGVARIRGNAFAHSTLSSIKLPSTLEEIGYGAFGWCFFLTEISIPDDVFLSSMIFANCGDLKTATFGKGCRTYYGTGGGIFNDCDNLETVVLGDDWYLGSSLIEGRCPKLKSITLGNTIYMEWMKGKRLLYLRNNDDNGEYFNYGPLTIYSYITEPCTYYLDFGGISFDNGVTISPLYPTKLYVPKGTKTLYEQLDEWNKCGEIIEMEGADIDGVSATVMQTGGNQYYSLNGQRLHRQGHGMQIVRMTDGRVRKLICR